MLTLTQAKQLSEVIQEFVEASVKNHVLEIEDAEYQAARQKLAKHISSLITQGST